MDARKAVRDRFEATRCWQYDYDGLNPPPDASECSTPYGSAPVSLTEEEDKEFWSLMRSAPADIPSLKSLKKVRMGDNISLSSGGYSSSHDELFSSPREVKTMDDVDNSICSLGPFLDLLFEHV